MPTGIPAISVICDGGWSKRTHKHSYNALGGVAIIIGAETKQLLHIGIRNKYCSMCQRAEAVGCKANPHKCFKNWDQSSQAMEADIILEGFLKANEHGIRYMNIIADGDSSVFAKIKEEVPVWGPYVTKSECANHATKCLRSNLEKLVDEKPEYKGKGNLTKSTRIRLVSAVRCAIRMRSKEENKKEATKRLEKDIRNSIYHILGNHQNCSDFCKAKQKTSERNPNENVNNNIHEDEEDNEEFGDDIMNAQSMLWDEGSSIECQEESRLASASVTAAINPKLVQDVNILLDRVASKSERLLGNFTSNLAECWMSIRVKFDGGKVVNRCSRGSWHTRCFAAGLRFNQGPEWCPKVWEKATGSAAGDIFTSIYQKRARDLRTNSASKNKEENKAKRWKRKMQSSLQSNSKRARLAYGKDAIDVTPDLGKEELEKKMEKFLNEEIKISEDKIRKVEEKTRNQSQSKVWMTERKKRLTASNFGSIMKRRPNNKVGPIVRSLLYSKFKGNRATRLGLEKENITIQEYVEEKKTQNEMIKVEKVGLVVCEANKYLAASPDGKVIKENGENGFIEIKNVLYNKPVSLTQAATLKSIKGFCLELCDGNLLLKRNHNYYYQCQGILNITNSHWIDFVVRTEHPYQLHVERIYKDNDLWQNEMLPKLAAFYHKVLLPELAAPRHGKSPGIREPGVWVCQCSCIV